MSVVVFLGPTLPVAEARAELDADYRPPAAHGDVLRAARERPRVIAIVDGTFEGVPAVWHKEILWALSRGIHVFGASSMGALRAVELAPFGMEGVGAIYEAYASGALDADDEVAVAHATAEHGFLPLSIAMVDIRATLESAQAAGVVSAEMRRDLERIGKSLFYPDRAYSLLLQRAKQEGIAPAELDELQTFLASGKVHQKRLDALRLLRLLRERTSGDLPPKEVRWRFEHTDAWEHALASVARGKAP